MDKKRNKLAMKQKGHRPTIHELIIYERSYEHWQRNGFCTRNETAVAIKFDVVASIRAVLLALHNLEGYFGVPFFNGKELTEHAKQLYDLAKDVVTAHARLRKWRPQASRPTLKVGATAGILFHLLPDAAAHVMEHNRHEFLLDLTLQDGLVSVLQMVASGDINLGFAVVADKNTVEKSRDKATIQACLAKVRVNQGGWKKIDPVLIVPGYSTLLKDTSAPTVAFAKEHKSFSNTPIFVLPEERYPQLFDQLWSSGVSKDCVRVVPSFSAILAFVSLNQGVAVVPGFYDRLTEYNATPKNKSRQLRWRRITDMAGIEIVAYRRLDESAAIANYADKFIAAFERACEENHLRT